MYEIVIEETARRGGYGRRFTNCPTVIATAISREIALDMVSGMLIMVHKTGYAGHPFEWDVISIWDADTNQCVRALPVKEHAEDLDKWVGHSQWLKAGAVRHGHCGV